MLVIHDLVVHLISGRKLLGNRDPEQTMSILWASIESLMCCSIMQLIVPSFSDTVCVCALVCHRESFF